MKTLLSLLCLLLPLTGVAGPATPALVAGEDYVLIDGGQPYQPLAGKIEVVEVFAYWCPHCADFQPLVAAWKRKLPADVRFSYVPAVFSNGDAFALAYFAADNAGALDKTHEATYRAVHGDGLLAHNNASVDEIAWYYGTLGLDRTQLKAAMLGPKVQAQIVTARAFALRSRIEGTPTLIVNGRYRITPHSQRDALRIADQLIAQLRATR